ncbi:hypothetical protein FHR81_001287 [Actinoalloteichus hoggarensis]|uniref:hypothetical protein n=1 Tax=Actinoalloteichus hoggarensis TaxID=1470176 RepID=UPI0012FE0003|nr:hypothetical protein [Actinoalloteichus hoggarensis]MBB5920257.1 hypothetical protein [Actinoalloteichus hoggarensis]
MRRLRRLRLALIPAVLLLSAGCAGSTDLAKVTFERTTVPAAERENVVASAPGTGDDQGGGEPQAQEAAFTPEALRPIDPCALLDEAEFAQFGDTPEAMRADYSRCGYYGVDQQGESVGLTYTLGDSVFSEAEQASQEVAGLKTHVQSVDGDGGGMCFVRVITTDGENAKSLTIQLTAKVDDVCATGREFAEHAVELVREDPPHNAEGTGLLAGLDACETAEADEVAGWIGDEHRQHAYGLHDCTWSRTGVELQVGFRISYDPADAADVEEIDLAGATAYRVLDGNVYPECKVSWAHGPFGDGAEFEVVTVSMADILEEGVDTCALATEAAEVIKTRIPA